MSAQGKPWLRHWRHLRLHGLTSLLRSLLIRLLLVLLILGLGLLLLALDSDELGLRVAHRRLAAAREVLHSTHFCGDIPLRCSDPDPLRMNAPEGNEDEVDVLEEHGLPVEP